MLDKKQRLTKKKEFDIVFKGGRAVYGDTFGLKIIKNNLGFGRFGLIIGAKISKKAVERNKLRRRLREVIKKNLSGLKDGFDAVIIALPGATKKNQREVEQTIINLFKKLKAHKSVKK